MGNHNVTGARHGRRQGSCRDISCNGSESCRRSGGGGGAQGVHLGTATVYCSSNSAPQSGAEIDQQPLEICEAPDGVGLGGELPLGAAHDAALDADWVAVDGRKSAPHRFIDAVALYRAAGRSVAALGLRNERADAATKELKLAGFEKQKTVVWVLRRVISGQGKKPSLGM